MSVVRHIVMFDFSTLSKERVDDLINGFLALAKVPEVIGFEWGTECNVEDSSLGFTHSFLLSFESFDARTRYLNGKEHREYEKEVMKYRNKVLVFDYAAKAVK